MIPVAEIFGPTIQGEGPKAGIKTLFVRVVGCDFNCDWCDSKFAWKINDGTIKYTPEDLSKVLINKCNDTCTTNVVLTGGNPCLYDFDEVISVLHTHSISVDVETQGSIFPDWLKIADQIVFSPKAPSSKQPDVFEDLKTWICNNWYVNVCIKIPVFDDLDFDFAIKYGEFTDLMNIKLYLSVGNENVGESGDITSRILNKYRWLIDKTLQSNIKNVYILPQIHTLVWGNRQGV